MLIRRPPRRAPRRSPGDGSAESCSPTRPQFPLPFPPIDRSLLPRQNCSGALRAIITCVVSTAAAALPCSRRCSTGDTSRDDCHIHRQSFHGEVLPRSFVAVLSRRRSGAVGRIEPGLPDRCRASLRTRRNVSNCPRHPACTKSERVPRHARAADRSHPASFTVAGLRNWMSFPPTLFMTRAPQRVKGLSSGSMLCMSPGATRRSR
jgi:hypothetical protein